MTRRTLTVTALAAVLVGNSAMAAAVSRAPSAHEHVRSALRVRPDQADWEKIKTAAWLRNMGMARHRTAHFRVVAGTLGLSQLATVQPLAPGRCRTALDALYGNLLDLQNAEPGENFAPLRRFVAREPSIRACAPRRSGRER